ncbi:putative RAS small monomeric GTPase [Aspergillus ibericus CBS 121593]|uniref:Ras small monomeric GTPase n=1 Tax=Aspergillus ibericus CBS 121593 TaxID=1448316 RepID=A0A395HF40_9EURO|nr:ras small monomeric GTPase [Aspergillus ibericus CBS 121593]RAL06340.1 ras small monomeric GTPase [Aspergillus ibericus CBS 121593]
MADSPDKISITICGDGGCEDSYSVTRVVDGVPYFLSITDTAGQEEYRGLWAASNLRSDAFLLVYDITNRASLGALDYFMEMIDIETEQRAEDNDRLRKELGASAEGLDVGMPPPVKIVAGNKCDLKDSRVIGAREGLEYARKHDCGFMETSAREMVNIEETFALLVRRVVEARRAHYQKAPTAQQAPAGDSSTAAKAPAGAVASKEATEASSKRAQQRQSGLRGLFKGKQTSQDVGQADNLKPDSPISGQKLAGPAKPSIWRRLRCC